MNVIDERWDNGSNQRQLVTLARVCQLGTADAFEQKVTVSAERLSPLVRTRLILEVIKVVAHYRADNCWKQNERADRK